MFIKVYCMSLPIFNFCGPNLWKLKICNLSMQDGPSDPAEVTTNRKKVKTIFGEVTQEIQAFRLGWWYKKRK